MWQFTNSENVDGIRGPVDMDYSDHDFGAKKTNVTTKPAKHKPKLSSSSVVPYPDRLIKNGSQDKDVERIQRAVGVTPDGIFGPKTKTAVKAYQKRHGLTADGIVGHKTWTVMF